MVLSTTHRLFFRPVALIGIIILLTACNQSQTNRPVFSGELDGETAAIVNGEPIYIEDVELEAVAQGIIAPGEVFAQNHERYKVILDQLIDQRLLAQEAIERNLDLDKLARHRLAVVRERILGNLLVESIVESDVTEEAIREMYSEQTRLQQFEDEVRISLISVPDQQTANTVIREYRDGTEFSALAFKYSIDPETRIRGGDLGYLAPSEQPEPFLSAIGDTKVGSISSALQSEDSWHILKVDDRRKQAPLTLEEMRPRIVSFLTFEEINEIIRKLRVEADIDTQPTQPSEFPTTLPAIQGPAAEGATPGEVPANQEN